VRVLRKTGETFFILLKSYSPIRSHDQ
jgi:hypothetical protein